MYVSRRSLLNERIYTKDFPLFPSKDRYFLCSQPHTSSWGLPHTPQFCFVPALCWGEEKTEQLWGGNHMNNKISQNEQQLPAPQGCIHVSFKKVLTHASI